MSFDFLLGLCIGIVVSYGVCKVFGIKNGDF